MPRALPKDADGEALRKIAADGSDLSKPMYINFQVAVPDEKSAKALGSVSADPAGASNVVPAEFRSAFDRWKAVSGSDADYFNTIRYLR